jgi:predicted nucleic acid-binding protein
MAVAYVDTSCLVAIAFGERGAASLTKRLEGYDDLVSSNLLEAELRSTFARERVDPPAEFLLGVSWVIPDRPLSAEIARVLDAGYVRGGDCWHLATALYLAGDPAAMSFITLDARQKAVASALGFKA